MPRYARHLSQTGIYHVMIRGIDKMNIFLEKHDKDRFLETLIKMKAGGEYSLYAYCLMDNHVHLLIKEDDDPLQRTMKRICVSYSSYFNRKYERIGHLFQDRFRSESIENDEYILACTRYIHNNPVKGKIVKRPQDYQWSSYSTYIQKENSSDVINTAYILNMFSEDRGSAINQFKEYSKKDSEEEFIDYNKNKNKKSIDKFKIAHNILKKHNLSPEDLKRFKDKQKRNIILRQMKSQSNLSLREISKITGISKDTIHRA